MNRLNEFAESIKIHEGWYPGSRSYKNNSPGNLRWSKFQDGIRDGYSFFSTYQKGWDALVYDLKNKCLGNTKTNLGPNSTILQFCEIYSPKSDKNDPLAYANFIASRLNLSISTPLKEIYSETQPLKILVVLANFLVERESVIKDGFKQIADYFTSLGVDTTVDYITGNWNPHLMTIKGVTGENLDVVKDIQVMDSVYVKDILVEKINGHHFALYCYRFPMGNTPSEFSEVFKGAIIGQLPVMDVSDSNWVSMFGAHELLHGFFHRLNAETLLVKDNVHQKTWKDGYGEIVKNLLPFLPVILRPISDKPYTPYIPPMTEPERQNYILRFIYKIAELIKSWNSK